MARKQQNDPLRYAANLTALAAAVYLGVTALLRLAVGQLLRLFNKSATLENPIAVPEWVLGVFNVLLPAAGLAAAFWLLAVGVRATPMRLRISVQMPRDGRLWLFVPVFLGAGFLCSLLTTLLQRLLAAFTRYRAPEAIRLPQSGFATFCISSACVWYPPYWRSCWCAAPCRQCFPAGEHGFPSLYPVWCSRCCTAISRRCRLCSSCRCSWGWRPTVPALWRWEWRCTLLITQCRFFFICGAEDGRCVRLCVCGIPGGRVLRGGRGVSCGHSPPGRNAPFQAHPPGIRPQEPPEPSGAPGVCAAVPAGDGVHGAARGMAAVREIRKVGFIWMISR